MNIILLDTCGGQLEKLARAFGEVVPGCVTKMVTSGDGLLAGLRNGPECSLVVIDCVTDKADGTEDVIRKVREHFPDLPIVAVASEGGVEVARGAIEAGATDFLVRKGQLTDRVTTLLTKLRPQLNLIENNRRLVDQNKRLKEASAQKHHIVGNSPQILEMMERISRVAKIPRPVLITGERGTGKELVARAIHMLSCGEDQPMIVVNCAAFPTDLLESELFGHERGAFTSASEQKLGKFELASGGTLFLDEIGNMSLPFQQKILRVVEYGTFSRVGGTDELEVRVRIIAATNADLDKKIDGGEFMQDLYDRLSFEVINVPPLREREGDIAMLAGHFLTNFMREIPSLRGKVLSRSAIDILEKHPFPGNVRELKNIIERAAYRDVTNEITPVDIGMLPDSGIQTSGGTFKEMVSSFENKLILDAMAASGGNQAKAARSLGLSYHQFRYYLGKLDD